MIFETKFDLRMPSCQLYAVIFLFLVGNVWNYRIGMYWNKKSPRLRRFIRLQLYPDCYAI